MKYKSTDYAKALVCALIEKKTPEKNIAVHFLQLLKKNGDLPKASRILFLAQALLLKKTGNKKIMFETARVADIKNLVKAFAGKGDVVEEKINPTLIAGVKIVVDGDRQLDMSLLKKLENIF